VEVVASLSQGRTAAAQYGLFTQKSVPVIFEPPCIIEEGTVFVCSGRKLDISREVPASNSSLVHSVV